MRVTRRVLLWLEKRIEIPERTLHKVVGWHLREPENINNGAYSYVIF